MQREKVREGMSSRATALSEQTVPTMLEFEGRTIALQASPVGVDVDYIKAIAENPETAARAADIRVELGRCQSCSCRSDARTTPRAGSSKLESYERLIEGNPRASRHGSTDARVGARQPQHDGLMRTSRTISSRLPDVSTAVSGGWTGSR